MQIEINKVVYNIPTSLSQITLQQRIEFEETHGKLVAEMAAQVTALPDGDDKDMEYALFQIELACRNLSSYAAIPLEIVRHCEINQIMGIYAGSFVKLYEQQEEIELSNSFLWKEEEWFIQSPIVSHRSSVVFNEFIISKQVMKQMAELGNGQWQAMPILAAIFLRKKDEVFNEDLADTEGPRVKEMHQLPMDIALSVAFFFEKFNEYIHSNFTVFSDPGKSSGINMKAHFEKWGWLGFLSYVAKEANIFDISGNGKSRLQNIKDTKLYDVLIWASEVKDKEEIINDYYERKNKT